MHAKSLGKIPVPSPGTPVVIATGNTDRVVRARFAAVVGETGRVFLGVAGMVKATGAGVIKEFWPTGGGGGVADEITVDAPPGGLLSLSEYYVDANSSNEGLIVSYWTE